MKSTVYILAIATILAACGTDKNATETVENTETTTEELGKSYGPEKVDPSAAVSVADMVKTHGDKTEAGTYTFEGEIKEVCSKAGCWVRVDKGDGETILVRFKDHFTIPTDTKPGTKAIFHGEAMNKEVSVEMLQHFAEDAGKSQEEIDAITEPEFDLNFTADGITLKK